MTRAVSILAAVLFASDIILFLLFRWQKSRAKANKELYEEASGRNRELAAQLKKSQAAETIRQEERKNADEKIKGAYSGNSRERFDAINDGLRER